MNLSVGSAVGTMIFIIILVLVIVSSCIKIVPQTQAFIIERLGAYQGTWSVGLHFKVPIIDRIATKVILKEQTLDFPPQSVITKDNVTMKIDSIIFFQITDPRLYTYGVQNPISAMENLTATTLRNIIGALELDQTLTSRDVINTRMREELDVATDPWGIKVKKVEIKNIIPPAAIQDAMEKQMKAERERRESILRAEGEKQSTVLVAEGKKMEAILGAEAEKEAAILRAEAKKEATIREAEGQAQAILKVQQANAEGIPIICVNRFPEGGDYLKSYSDDAEAGRMQGEFMAANLPQGAQVVYLKGASGNQAAEARWEGFKKYCLDKRSDVKLLAFADAQWSTAEAMKDMSLWLDMFPKIDGVICGNDGMAMGAIAAMKGAGRLSGVLVSGVDATDDALAAIKAGEMAQTVKQDAKGQAAGAFKLVQQAMQGQKPENILVPFTAITRENVSQFAK